MVSLFLFTDYTEAMVKTSSPTSPLDDNKLKIILPIVLVCLFIIVVCVIVFVLRRRQQKKRDAVDNAHALSHKGSITMRDRLRAESLKSLDSRLLGLYDPNKLRQYNLDHVQYVKDLGEGFFGKVFQGTVELLNVDLFPHNSEKFPDFFSHSTKAREAPHESTSR